MYEMLFFSRNYICMCDINLFTLNEGLRICRQPIPVASNTDASKITTMVASQLVRDVMIASC